MLQNMNILKEKSKKKYFFMFIYEIFSTISQDIFKRKLTYG